jgi:hypothetical protein
MEAEIVSSHGITEADEYCTGCAAAIRAGPAGLRRLTAQSVPRWKPANGLNIAKLLN